MYSKYHTLMYTKLNSFALVSELGTSVSPTLGSIQSAVFMDLFEDTSYFRVDTLHRNPLFPKDPFVTLIWECNSEGVRRYTKEGPVITGVGASRDEALQMLEDTYPIS